MIFFLPERKNYFDNPWFVTPLNIGSMLWIFQRFDSITFCTKLRLPSVFFFSFCWINSIVRLSFLDCIPTVGGDAEGACCAFPFNHGGITYTDSCAPPDVSYDNRWCIVAGQKSGECVDGMQFNLL